MSLKCKKYNCNLKPLSIGVSLALSSFATMAADSPFAIAPQHLSSTATIRKTTVTTPHTDIHKQQQSVTNTTVRGMQGAKPNIMLVLDDSSSMTISAGRSTRQQILQNSLANIVQKYNNRVNWGIKAFNTRRYNVPIGTNTNTVLSLIKTFPANGTTPTITTYIEAANDLNNAIQYRCQKNYLVMVSDGDSNFDVHLPSNTRFDYSNNAIRNGQLIRYHYPQWLAINKKLNEFDFWKKIFKSSAYNRTYNRNSSKYLSMCNPAYLTTGKPYTDPGRKYERDICDNLPQEFAYYPYSGITDGLFYNFSRVRGLNSIQKLTPHLDLLNDREVTYQNPGYAPIFPLAHLKAYSGDMLGYLSEPLSKTDLRTASDGNDKAGQSWDSSDFPNQNITTFTIGFGNSLSDYGLALLKGGASTIQITNPITKKMTSQRAYYSATDENSLQQAFDSIFNQIERENPPPSNSNPIDLPPTTNTLPISTPTADTPNRQQSVMAETSYATSPPSATGASNSIPNMAASVFVPAGLKSSELRFYALNSKAQADTSSWSVADFSQRKALIMTSSGVVRWPNNDASLTNTFFNLSDETQPPKRTDEWNKALLPWITRIVEGSNDSKIKEMNYPTPYRIRPIPLTDSPRNAGVDEYNMGDVLDTPIVATGKNGIAQGNRQEFLITAANDGMVYLFQSNPDVNAKNPYSLKLNYLPATMPRQTLIDTHATHYKDLAHEDYAKDSARPHLFMINGGITVRTTSAKSNRQNTFMVGALGQGGRGMYALNIGGKALDSGNDIGLNAEDSTWNTSVPLYESNPNNNSTDFSSLGYTVGYPQIGRIAKYNTDGSLFDKTLQTGVYYASFLSSGFSSPNASQETALYIQDALGVDVGGGAATAAKANGNAKGKLLAKVVVQGGVGGLASPTLLDVNRDGVYDFVFAGDYGGNMYRFDLRKIDLSNGKVTEGAVKKIYSGSITQPITSAPAISMQKNGRYVVAFGTGSDMYARDYNSTAEQAVYGIYQRFNTSNLDPININDSNAAEAEKPLTADNLLKQTLTTAAAKMAEDTSDEKIVTVREGSTNAIEDPNDKSKLAYGGWKVRLGNTTSVQDGERVVVTPTVIFGTLILSTRIYKEKPITTVNNNAWSENNWQTDGWIKVSEKFDQNHTELSWSPWKNISTNSTSTTNSGDICTGTVNTSTEMQEREKRVNYETITTYEKVQPSENQSSGWILVLNATNGGAVKVSSGTGVDFLGKYDASNFNPNDTAHSNTYFTVGLYSSSGLPNHTLLTNDSNVHSLGSAMTRDGEARTNGEDGDLTPGGEKAKDDCFNNTDGNYVLTGNTATGIGATFSVVGRRCGKKIQIRRLSWREIF
ncbi:PilC/PilY family type IV pilus protein [Kingella kingae]|uniref:PilC/PilY family type IV pilus protein n=1 Tax=Kingella kingae TaxID=504 RepID=UPI00254B2A34|nr:PilC/PilY family type IV pilus protein [Kingella kingae]MDK4564665.1 PilC/PilY family type IV pilus protein [Kingella kingae]MDK4579221.1 PilC/PilY family type IV pilus protein [Kingella kingae]MDK4627411.1 PilC/PilY family type IV pilus protein [Kingella kingae]MDK4675134.1 PilC/PilY family type IV pilus protein [Kingella kingae]